METFIGVIIIGAIIWTGIRLVVYIVSGGAEADQNIKRAL